MREIAPDEKMVGTTIITENGEPMLALSSVESPVKPSDATHLGPAGDYWKVTSDDRTRSAHADIWLGDDWERADELFAHGIMEVGLTFDSLSDELPPISLQLMIADQMVKALGL